MIVAPETRYFVINRIRISSPVTKAALAYLSASMLTFLVVAFTTRFYSIDLSIPMWYRSDFLFYYMLIKGLTFNEWLPFGVPNSAHLGAPFGSSLYDFPGAGDANLMFMIMKCISFFTSDPARVFNYYTIVTYFLTVYTSIYALRHFRISFKVAIVFSILFAFLPYHFMRMMGHLNIALYILIPFYVLIMTWIWSKKPIFFRQQHGKYSWDFKNYKALFSIGVLSLSGLTAIYYNFFFCLLAFVAGIAAVLYRKSWRHLWVSFILMAIVGASALINLAPYIKYRIEHDKNPMVATRSHMEAELYGLKIAQLLLPFKEHRNDLLSGITYKYYNNGEATEPSWSSLGLIGAAGFLFLLFYCLLPIAGPKSLYFRLGLVLIAVILFTTVGGFSSLFALLVFPQFRGYNRISIFIAFISLLPVALAVNRYRRYLPSWLANAGLAALLLLGIYDQTNPGFTYTYFHDDIKNEFLSDRAFINDVEKSAPPNALIFQLPFVTFPESPEVGIMDGYEHIKGYIHSSTLSWSYGSVKGRLPGFWYEQTANLLVDRMLHNISIAGFSGVYIDRFGYNDNAAAVEAKLAAILQKQPLVSQNQRMSYFDITAYRENLLKTIDKAAFESLKQTVLYPTEDSWFGEYWPLDKNEQESWRWCGQRVDLKLTNHSNVTRKHQLTMELRPSRPQPSQVVIQGEGFSDVISLENSVKKYERIIELPPKENVSIRFQSDLPLIKGRNRKERQNLAFAIYNFAARDVSDSPVNDRLPGAAPDIVPIKALTAVAPQGGILETWEGECFSPEKNEKENWRWCGTSGKVTLTNSSTRDQKKQLALEFRLNRPEPYEVTIRSKGFREVVKVDQPTERFEKTVTIPAKGQLVVDFQSNAAPLKLPNDPRKLVFAIYNFGLESIGAAAPKALEPISETWAGECFPPEKNEKESWRWCGTSGKVTLVNPSATGQKKQMALEFRLNRPEPYEVTIRSEAFREVVRVDKPTERFEKTITIPAKSQLVIDFQSSAPPLKLPSDSRKLVFAVYNFELKDAD